MADTQEGIRRLPSGRGFRYLDATGKPIRENQKQRIKSLAIPPAWTNVWICADPQGHLQATGRDAKGRKQFRYHPRWREVRDASKYERLVVFSKALPVLRSRVSKDLARPGLPREKVLAAIVRLLDKTFIRVGNEAYARQNGSVGLTTMQDRHVAISGEDLHFQFRGKGRIWHDVTLRDRRLARIVKQCQELPGQELFQYLDEEGTPCDVGSADVNDYLREITGQEFTAKDFRTWAGTQLAAAALQEFKHFDSLAQLKRNVVRAIEAVAEQLGNTKDVCRKCYIHPGLIEAYLDGTLRRGLRVATRKRRKRAIASSRNGEAALLTFLHQRST